MKIKVVEKGVFTPSISLTPETFFEGAIIRQVDGLIMLEKTDFDTEDGTATFKMVFPCWPKDLQITRFVKEEL